MATFKMRQPPTPVERSMVQKNVDLRDFNNLQEVVDRFVEIDPAVQLHDIKINVEYGYEETFIEAYIMMPEDDESLAGRQKRYEKDLKEYQRWIKANHEKIMQAKTQRKGDLQKKLKKIQAELANLDQDE